MCSFAITNCATEDDNASVKQTKTNKQLPIRWRAQAAYVAQRQLDWAVRRPFEYTSI